MKKLKIVIPLSIFVVALVLFAFFFKSKFQKSVPVNKSDTNRYHKMVLEKDASEVSKYIDAGIDVDCDFYGSTALHNAATNGDDKIIKLLLDAGADIDKKILLG